MRSKQVDTRQTRSAFAGALILAGAIIVTGAVLPPHLLGQPLPGLVGIKVGAITTGIDSEIDAFLNTDWRSGFSAGGFVSMDRVRSGRISALTLRADLLFSQRGFGFRMYDQTAGLIPGEADLRSLEFHTDLGLRVPWPNRAASVRLFAGPTVGFELSCKVRGWAQGMRFTGDCYEPVVGIRTQTVDLGFSLGGGIDYKVLPMTLVIDGRYTHGLRNLNKNAARSGTIESRAWTFTVGLGWPF